MSDVKVKRIIIARHGSGWTDLDEFGLRQTEKLALAVKASLNGGGVALLSSTAPKAEQSAEIFSGILDIPFERHELLWAGFDSPGRNRRNGDPVGLTAALQLIEASEMETVILITHLEYTRELPRAVKDRLLGDGADFPFEALKAGQAWVIDCEAKTCTRLPEAVGYEI